MSGGFNFYRQSGQVIAGESIAAVISFTVLAVCARTLGPTVFGQLALLMAFVASIELICNFQSGRLLIRYGAQSLAAQDTMDLARFLKLSVLLDVAGAAMATVVAVLAAGLVLPSIGNVEPGLVYLFAMGMLFNIVGHATALLRLTNCFGFLAMQRVAGAFVRLLGIGLLLVWHGLTLRNVVIAFVIADLLSRILLFLRGRREAVALGLAGFMGQSLDGIRRAHGDVVSFVLFSSVNDWVLKVVQQLDIFIVAALLSPADAGFFRVVKSLGAVPALMSGAIGQVIYPQIAKLSTSDGHRLRTFLGQLWGVLVPVAVLCCVVYWVIAEMLVSVLFGSEYLPVVLPSIIYMLGSALELVFVPLTPLFLVEGRQRDIFVSYAAAASVYLVVLWLGSTVAGLEGASAAFAALCGTFGLSMGIFRAIRKR